MLETFFRNPGEYSSIILTVLAAFAALMFKIFQIFKSERNEESLVKDEDEFRRLLLDEIKTLRESNRLLMYEKADLVARIAKLESEKNWMFKYMVEDPDNKHTEEHHIIIEAKETRK